MASLVRSEICIQRERGGPNVKILLINSLYWPQFLGGAERIVQSLAQGLAHLGHDVVVISVAPTRHKTAYVNGVKVYYLSLKNLMWPFGRENPTVLKPLYHALDTYNPFMAAAVGSIIDHERPTLVHTNTLAGLSTAVWQQVKSRQLPLVHTLMDYYLLCPRSTMFCDATNCVVSCRRCSVFGYLRRRMSPSVDAVVALSRYVLALHLDAGYFVSTPVRKVVYSGYEPPRDALQSVAVGGKVRLGFLGRLHPTKGIEVLLDAVTRLPSTRWELWIAGRGTEVYEAALRKRWRAPNIHYLGHIQPEALFSMIDVLVVPSLWNEPFGMVVIEAYANGVPVIASRRGGLAEIVEHGGTGFLFDPSEPDSLEHILAQVISAPTTIHDMRSRVLNTSNNFSPTRMMESYLAIYGTLAPPVTPRVDAVSLLH